MFNTKDSTRVKNDHHLVLPMLLREVHATKLAALARMVEGLRRLVHMCCNRCEIVHEPLEIRMFGNDAILSTRCPAHPFQRILSAGSATNCTLLVLGKSQLRLHVGKHLLFCKNTHLGITREDTVVLSGRVVHIALYCLPMSCYHILKL